MTWIATNTTPSRDRLRCSPVTTKRGSPGSRPWRLTSTPRRTTPVSSSRLTTPVALLAYQSAVLWVIPFIGASPAVAVRGTAAARVVITLWDKNHRPGAGRPMARLSIPSERPGLPDPPPAGDVKRPVRYTCCPDSRRSPSGPRPGPGCPGSGPAPAGSGHLTGSGVDGQPGFGWPGQSGWAVRPGRQAGQAQGQEPPDVDCGGAVVATGAGAAGAVAAAPARLA